MPWKANASVIRRNAISCVIAATAVLLALSSCAGRHAVGAEYRRFTAPDGRYAVVVRFDAASPAPIVPGSSGDRAGFVQLVDRHGEVVQQVAVDMVSRVDQVTWHADEVEVKLVATWRLESTTQ